VASLKNKLVDLRCLRADISAITELKKLLSQLNSIVEKPVTTGTPTDRASMMPAASASASASDTALGNTCSNEQSDCNLQEAHPAVIEQGDWVTVVSQYRPEAPKPAARRLPPPVRVNWLS